MARGPSRPLNVGSDQARSLNHAPSQVRTQEACVTPRTPGQGQDAPRRVSKLIFGLDSSRRERHPQGRGFSIYQSDTITPLRP